MTKNTNTLKPALPAFAPEVEARRPHFEALAENLIAMLNLEYQQDALDVSLDDAFVHEGEARHVLMNAIERHMRTVADQLLLLEPSTIRRFYVDFRLHIEQMRLDAQATRGDVAK